MTGIKESGKHGTERKEKRQNRFLNVGKRRKKKENAHGGGIKIWNELTLL